jgi:uncharacterized protein YegP (UPF0339 family)
MAKGPGFYVYEDEAGEYRWRLRAGNNETIADSAEGYETANGARAAVGQLMRIMDNPQLHVHDDT